MPEIPCNRRRCCGRVRNCIAGMCMVQQKTMLVVMHGQMYCREVYDAASPNYRGRCTAPLLVDKRSRRLVCNESSDIVRMLNSVMLPGTSDVDLYPPELAAEIDSVNDMVHNNVGSLAKHSALNQKVPQRSCLTSLSCHCASCSSIIETSPCASYAVHCEGVRKLPSSASIFLRACAAPLAFGTEQHVSRLRPVSSDSKSDHS